jgi:biofilm PGA synthesis N-glycosyltransferase PgaC
MEHSKSFKVTYLAFLIPFVLAGLSWTYFPAIAQWIIANVFGYAPVGQTTNLVWNWTIQFFYSWYTFVSIDIAGVWITAAVFSRRRRVKPERVFYPMVSFLVPAYNQEKNIANCIASLFACTAKYAGNCEIIIIDDGSKDHTYEAAWSAVQLGRRLNSRVRSKIVRHSANLGKTEALRTGVNQALGSLLSIVDADSEWSSDTLVGLVDYKLLNGKGAVTGYVHPNGEGSKGNLIVRLQRLEYSQGLGIGRCAQGLGDKVLVVSGAIGVYDADLLREIFSEKNVCSVTEDLEITLELHKKGAKIGYVNFVKSETVVPRSLRAFWCQRLRWFTGWLHNTLGIHKNLMTKRSWVTGLIWFSYLFEYAGSFVDLSAMAAFPFLWGFAPDPTLFGFNLILFFSYGLLIGIINQAIALRFAYGSYNYDGLVFYTPLYPLLRLINVFARSRSVLDYMRGKNGIWHR